jgi:hypothetical protein
MPKPGELWFITPTDETGPNIFVCVLSTEAEWRGRLLVAFAHTEPEVATEHHLRYTRGEAAPWPVVVATDWTAAISGRRFLERVGALPDGDLTPVLLASRSGRFAAEIEHRRGMPLHGPHDTRLTVIEDLVDCLWRYWYETD